MVMTAPSRMVIWEANDRTTKGVPACRERSDEGGGVGGVRFCVARWDRFALAVIARRDGSCGSRGARRGSERRWASDATHSWVAVAVAVRRWVRLRRSSVRRGGRR